MPKPGINRKENGISMRNKVCFFNTNKDWGGGEKWHYEMASKLHTEGYEVISISRKGSPLEKKYKKAGIPNISMKIGNLSFFNIFKILRLKRIFQKERVGIIIMNLSADVKIASFAAKEAGVKKIIYRRGSAIPISASILNKLIFKKCITHVLANSQETRRTVNAKDSLIPVEKIHVIYNGIHISEVNKPSVEIQNTEKIILGNVGRLAPQKNQSALLYLAKKLKEENLNFQMIIAGDGKLKPELVKLSQELNLENEVIFKGFEEDVHSFMKNINIFILSSLWEGFGYVLAEAMFAGKPIVAFNNSSNPEIVADNVTGFLVPTNDIDALAEKVKLLADNPDLGYRMGKKGQERVLEKFTFERAYRDLKEFLFHD